MTKSVECKMPNGEIILLDPKNLEYRVRIFLLLSVNNNLCLFKSSNGTKVILPSIIAEKGLALREAILKGMEELIGIKVRGGPQTAFIEHFSFENGKAYHNLDYYYKALRIYPHLYGCKNDPIKSFIKDGEEYYPHWVQKDRHWWRELEYYPQALISMPG